MKLVVLSALLFSVLALPSHANIRFDAKSYEVGVVARDGHPDLVIAQAESSHVALRRVTLLLGKGDGTFAARRVIHLATPPLAGATGDLNGDGHVDLVFTTASGIVVLFGRGDATFQPARIYPMTSPPSALWSQPFLLHIADMDGDGKPDLIFPDGDHALHVLWQGAQGSFGPESTYATAGYLPDDVALGDFNKDGLLDAATSDRANEPNGWYVSVFLNHGKRILGPATRNGAPYKPNTVLASDLDGKGSLDLVGGGHAAFADLDEDGLPDLATPSFCKLPDGSPTCCLILARGMGGTQFTEADTVDLSTNQAFVMAADLNHDERQDLLTWYDGVTVLLNQTPSESAPR